MGIALLTLLAAAEAADECPDRLDRLDLVEAAERALVEADLAAADARLRELEAAVGCGPLAEPELLGRMWLVEGAWLTLQGDAEAAADSWRAAARVAPGRWVVEYGAKLRKAYEDANAAPPRGDTLITLDPPLFRWIGAVDGEVVAFPATVPAGLHIVQVGPDEDHVAFSRILLAFPDTPSVVVTGLLEPTTTAPAPAPAATEPEPQVVEKPPRDPGALALHVGIGGDAIVGRPVVGEAADEPGVKIVLPVETGLTVRPARSVWVRTAVVAGPLLGGAFVYEDQYGEGVSPAALGAHLAGGYGAPQGDIGALVGVQWPGRVVARALLGGVLGRSPLRLEGRVGIDGAIGRSPEPAFSLVLSFAPRFVRAKSPEPEPGAE